MAATAAGQPERFVQRYTVGWGDLDSNGHMANTAFLDKAADTRMRFFAANGFPIARFAAERFGPVVLRDEVVYRKELMLLEDFTVDLELAGMAADGVRFRLRNTFRNPENVVAAQVTSEGVWFDLGARKPRLPPAELSALQGRLRRSADFVEIPSRPSGKA